MFDVGETPVKVTTHLGTKIQKTIGGRMGTEKSTARGPLQRLGQPKMTAEERAFDSKLSKWSKVMTPPVEEDSDQIYIRVSIAQPLQLRVLNIAGGGQGQYQQVCRFNIQPSNISFSRSASSSSFHAFGLEVESSNRVKIWQLFHEQMKQQVFSFFGNPILESHLHNKILILKLRLLLAQQMFSKQEKAAQQAGVLFKKMQHDKDHFSLLAPEPLGGTQVLEKTPFSAKKTQEYFAPKP